MNENEIQTNSEIIIHILKKKGEMNYKELKILTKIPLKKFYITLGWLLKENKIKIFGNNIKSTELAE